MADLVQHAARGGAVLDLDRVADAAQAERAQRVELALVGAVLGLDLRHLHAGSVPSAGAAAASPSAAASTTASSTPASASVPATTSAATTSGSVPAIVSAATSAPPPSPSTLLIDRPRSSATS